jgi:hypothetical protein
MESSVLISRIGLAEYYILHPVSCFMNTRIGCYRICLEDGYRLALVRRKILTGLVKI